MLQDRINKIQEYFGVFNVSDGAIVVGVRFPNKWKLINTDDMKKAFNVQCQMKDDTYFFLTELENGSDCVFDAIEEVITFNKAIEEKSALLEKKAKELSDLFVNEPLERLKRLQFVITEEKKKGGRKKATEVKEEAVDTIKEKNEDKPIPTESKKETVGEEKKEEKEVKTIKKNNKKNSSLMDLAVSVAEK